MVTYQLKIHLLSETTFGRGDGVAGAVDQEVVHDQYGFPFLRGRTLKGVLSEECDGIVALLPGQARWNRALSYLFGKAGSLAMTEALWYYGDAMLPELLRRKVMLQQHNNELQPRDILHSLTTIRRQTAIDPGSGTPDTHSLRTARVLIRKLTFTSQLTAVEPHNDQQSIDNSEQGRSIDDELMLLAAGCRALRHIGAARTRGRGHIRCSLHDQNNKDITETLIASLKKVVTQ